MRDHAMFYLKSQAKVAYYLVIDALKLRYLAKIL
jgi:hypothetical protein